MLTAADVAAFSGHRLIAYYWQAGWLYEVQGTSIMDDDAWDSLCARLRREWADLPDTEHKQKIDKKALFESNSFLGQGERTPLICQHAAMRRSQERISPVAEPEINSKIDRAIGAYLDLREQRAQLKKEFDELDKELVAKMDGLEVAMLRYMDKVGTSQLKSVAGMAYVETSKVPQCGDWQALYGYIQETGRFDMLQKRLGSTAIKDLESDTGELPPGVTMTKERCVRFKSPK
jgi:hypothetical protein